MTLKFYFHPLSSFCHKALIALYENETPFEPVIVNFGEEASRAAFLKLWPGGKFPMLRDETGGRTVPESSIIIEYLAQHYPGRSQLVPADADLARQTRLRDRFFDLFIHVHMQKVIGDRLRPQGHKDSYGVADARTQLRKAYDMLESDIAGKTWAMGEAFTMADCAAAPALFYGRMVEPFSPAHANVAAYLDRLMARAGVEGSGAVFRDDTAMTARHIGAVSLLVGDYDEAIAWFTGKLGFVLVEDTGLGAGKRWVVVAPPDSRTRLVLAQPANVEQARALGQQAGGRVFLFLDTDDFARDHAAFRARGVTFLEEPRYELYGTVAVFEDVSGNRWDLIQPKT